MIPFVHHSLIDHAHIPPQCYLGSEIAAYYCVEFGGKPQPEGDKSEAQKEFGLGAWLQRLASLVRLF